MWEDEIHYQGPVLLSPTLHSFRADIGPLLRPFLDFAVRRWLWFSKWGFSPYEQRLKLVSLLYSGIHLVAWMILPWTPYVGLRFMAVLLLGTCLVETNYSTEAQGYSFSSLAPTLMAFAFLWSCSLVERKKPMPAFIVLVLAWTAYLNSHFFAWPSCVLWSGLAAGYVAFDKTLVFDDKKKYLQLLLAGFAMALLFSAIADKPGLYHLLFKTPAPKTALSLPWREPLPYLAQAWSWLNLPSGLFLIGALAGCMHPQRSKRYAVWGVILTILVAKYGLVLSMMTKSTYAIFDRYLIMFISPAILTFALGMESISLWCNRWFPRSESGVAAAALLFVLFYSGKFSLRKLISHAREGLATIRQMPPNYSPNFHFFERVKAYQRPALILSNHCWASDIPKLYMNKIGEQTTKPRIILNTIPGCETSPGVLSSEIRRFMSSYREDGIVVYFYENGTAGPIPCGINKDALYQRPEGSCVGIVPAKIFIPPCCLNFKSRQFKV